MAARDLTDRLRAVWRHRWVRRGLIVLVVLVVLGVGLFWALLYSPFEGDHEGDLLGLVPADVDLLVAGRDLAGMRDRWMASADRLGLAGSRRWRAFWDSAGVRLLTDGLDLPRLERRLDRLGDQSRGLLTADNLLEQVGRELVVAARHDRRGALQVLLLMRVGGRAKLAVAALQRAVRWGAAAGEAQDDADVPLVRLGPRGPYVARWADVVLVATSRALIDEALGVRRSGGGLAGTPRFEAALHDEGDGLRVFCDVTGLERRLKLLAALDDVQLPFPLPLFVYFIKESVDTEALDTISGRVFVRPGSYRRLFWEGDLGFRPRRLSTYHGTLYRQRAQQFRSLARLPEGVVFARALQIDPLHLWSFGQAQMGPAVASWFESLQQVAAEVYNTPRPDALEAALIPLLGSEVGTLLMRVRYEDGGDRQAQGYPLPGMAFMIASPDAAQLARKLDALFARPRRRLSTGAVRRDQTGGVDISLFDLDIGLSSIRPCYGAVGDSLVLASHPLVLRQLKAVLDGRQPAAKLERVGPGLRNLRMHTRFDALFAAIHDIAPQLAEEIVGNQMRSGRMRRALRAEVGRTLSEAEFEEELSRRREAASAARADRLRRGLDQYRLLEAFDLEWTASRGRVHVTAALKVQRP